MGRMFIPEVDLELMTGILSILPSGSVLISLGLVEFALADSSSAKIVSSLDSTPATACCRKEPHLEVDFVDVGCDAITTTRAGICLNSRP